jgi:hypothetical protein
LVFQTNYACSSHALRSTYSCGRAILAKAAHCYCAYKRFESFDRSHIGALAKRLNALPCRGNYRRFESVMPRQLWSRSSISRAPLLQSGCRACNSYRDHQHALLYGYAGRPGCNPGKQILTGSSPVAFTTSIVNAKRLEQIASQAMPIEFNSRHVHQTLPHWRNRQTRRLERLVSKDLPVRFWREAPITRR